MIKSSSIVTKTKLKQRHFPRALTMFSEQPYSTYSADDTLDVFLVSAEEALLCTIIGKILVYFFTF